MYDSSVNRAPISYVVLVQVMFPFAFHDCPFLSALTAFIIEGDLREVIWRRRMGKKIENKQIDRN